MDETPQQDISATISSSLLPDALVADVGLVTAGVLAAMWRFSRQSAQHVCTASAAAIGNRVGLRSRNVYAHINRLIQRGYVIDLTPGVTGRPHHHQMTEKTEALFAAAFAAIFKTQPVMNHHRSDGEPVTNHHNPN